MVDIMEARLARLEREARFLRAGMIAAVSLLLLAAEHRPAKDLVMRSDDGQVETVVNAHGLTIRRAGKPIASLRLEEGDDSGRITGTLRLGEAGKEVSTTLSPGSLFHSDALNQSSELSLERLRMNGKDHMEFEVSHRRVTLISPDRHGLIELGLATGTGAQGIRVSENHKLVVGIGSGAFFQANDPSLRGAGAIFMNDFRSPSRSGRLLADGFHAYGSSIK